MRGRRSGQSWIGLLSSSIRRDWQPLRLRLLHLRDQPIEVKAMNEDHQPEHPSELGDSSDRRSGSRDADSGRL